jgi:thiosulfate reductase cytochrome b subunit
MATPDGYGLVCILQVCVNNISTTAVFTAAKTNNKTKTQNIINNLTLTKSFLASKIVWHIVCQFIILLAKEQ